jgi:hypothetical protein
VTWSETDLQALIAKGNVSVHGQDTAVSRNPEKAMTQTEEAFVNERLEPMLHDGTAVFWMFEPAIRMKGQTYTPDFMVLLSDGIVRFYEIKGGYSLGSEGRSSVKIRWAESVHGSDRIEFWWARLKGGEWKERRVKTKFSKPPIV